MQTVPLSLNLGGKLFSLATPQVMGIINTTPDSFYAGSRTHGAEALRARIRQILDEGGTMVDVGGCSTRPGNTLPNEAEECRRLRPALELLSKEFPEVPVSVDTFRSNVAKMAVEEYGVHLINDIAGGAADPDMYKTIARLRVPYILMHIEGTPETMHRAAVYQPNVETALYDYFRVRVEDLREAGVEEIVLDAGFGFSKSSRDNYRLLMRSGEALRPFRLPILVGVSRKRMVWQCLESSPAEALNGTTVLHTAALLTDAADILRVHDVREAVEAVKLTRQLSEAVSPIEGELPPSTIYRLVKPLALS